MNDDDVFPSERARASREFTWDAQARVVEELAWRAIADSGRTRAL